MVTWFPSIKTIDVALNKILRKVWKLPTRSHTGVVHCVAHVSTVSNILFQRFHSLLSKASSSSSTLLRTIFRDSIFHPFSYAGYNFCCGHHHLREYTIRNMYELSSPLNQLFCSVLFLDLFIHHFFYTFVLVCAIIIIIIIIKPSFQG